VPGIAALPSLGQLSAPLGYISAGLLFALALDNALSKRQLIFFLLVIAFNLVNRTLTGSLAQTVSFVVFFGIIFWSKKRIIPWYLIIITFLFIVIFNPVKSKYREYTWGNPRETELSYIDKINLFHKATLDYYSGENLFSAASADTSTVNRLAHISIFAYVVDLTPSAVPYWMGDSYQTLWSSFIPRVLWPGKPKATVGQEFGHRYYLLGPEDESTSFNLPWLVEFYANFGTAGVVGGMFVVGLLFRFLVQKFSVPSTRRIEYIFGISIIFGLWYAESNLALMVGGVLLTYLAFVFLLRVLTARTS